MEPILLTDNSISEVQISNLDFENLWSVANRSLKDLVAENENFLIYPPNINESKDKIGDLNIFSLSSREYPGEGRKCSVSTGNLMGFFRCGALDKQTEVHIQSRFIDEKFAGNDWFLPYMLSKVLNFNVLENDTSQKQDPLFDLLVLLFPRYLVNACQKGLFRQYVVHEYNDSRVKGAIDVNRHIHYNVPFTGKIAYRTRDYSYDNPVMQLVRHTIEFIRHHRYASLLHDENVAYYVTQVCEATPSYCLNERKKVLDKNRRDVSHPYLSEYTDLQKLCRMILLYDDANFGMDQEDVISGILFDGAWLWEEYLNIVLEESGVKIKHAKNKTGGNTIHPLVNENDKEIGLFYPDFYCENPGFVMDAKYKRLENNNPHAGDLQQVIAYMHVLSAKSGVYLHPSQDSEISSRRLLGTLKGLGGELFTFGLQIPKGKESFTSFKESIGEQENVFVDFVKERIAEARIAKCFPTSLK